MFAGQALKSAESVPAGIMVALSSEGPEQFKSLLKDAKCI